MLRRLVCLLCALALAACVPPEEPDRFVRYRSVTTMGAIQDRGELVVGIDPSLAPFSGRRNGFVNEVARFIAAELRVDLVVRPLRGFVSDDDLAARGWDLAFPMAPLTERLARQNAFTTPYWVGHERLLARGAASTPDDLSGRRVCQVLAPETGRVTAADIPAVVPGARVGRQPAPGTECARALRTGDVAALSAPDHVLAHLRARARGYLLSGQLSTYGLAAMVPAGARDMQQFVDATVAEAISEGAWERWYRRHLAGVLGPRRPPELTLSEVATIYPRHLEPATP